MFTPYNYNQTITHTMTISEILTLAVDVHLRSVESYNKELSVNEKNRLLRIWNNQIGYYKLLPKGRRPIRFIVRENPDNTGAMGIFEIELTKHDDITGLSREMLRYLTARGISKQGIRRILHMDAHKIITMVDLLDECPNNNGTAINQRIYVILDMLNAILGNDRWNEYLGATMTEELAIAGK